MRYAIDARGNILVERYVNRCGLGAMPAFAPIVNAATSAALARRGTFAQPPPPPPPRVSQAPAQVTYETHNCLVLEGCGANQHYVSKAVSCPSGMTALECCKSSYAPNVLPDCPADENTQYTLNPFTGRGR